MANPRSGNARGDVPELSGRILTFRYAAALAILAMLAVSSHFAFTRVLHEHGGAVYLNQVSGEQQTQAQRIARYAAEYASGDQAARGRLLDALAVFTRNHEALMKRIEAGTLPDGAQEALETVYLGDRRLRADVDAYIAAASTVAAASSGTSDLKHATAALLEQADGRLDQGLTEVVAIYQRFNVSEYDRLERMQNYLLIMVFLTLAMEAVIIFNPMVRRIVQHTGDLMKLASTDALTGVLNRRGFAEHGFAEVRRGRGEGKPTCLLAIDVDDFKKVNDTMGHAAGDAVLAAMAKSLEEKIRRTDIVARTGGEEFAVLLPDIRLDVAAQMAERLRADIAGRRFATEAGPVKLTISIGVSVVHLDEKDLSAVMVRADRALYQAKAAGRNRVVIADAASDLVRAVG